jgi:hypothetical protein
VRRELVGVFEPVECIDYRILEYGEDMITKRHVKTTNISTEPK